MQLNPTPLVSIIIPTYNRASFLKITLESILNQTYQNFEVIIIDDASLDSTQTILAEFEKKDARIRHITNKKNLKIVRTLNRGLQEAAGVYIARADDDDPWVDIHKLESQITFLESHPDCVLIGTGAIVVNEDGKELFRYLQPETDSEIRKIMLFNNPFVHPTVVFRHSVLKKTGYYDESSTDVEDWDLWMRMGKYGNFHNLPTYSIHRYYGVRGISIVNRARMSRTRLIIIKRYREYYPHYFLALIFNIIQRLYTLLPYQKSLNEFLFRMKRKTFDGK